MIRCLLFLVPWISCLAVQAQLASSDSLLKLKNASDSLSALTAKPIDQLKYREKRLDSLQHSLQSKLDSLTKFSTTGTLTDKMSARIITQSDSLRKKIVALQTKGQVPEEIRSATTTVEKTATQSQQNLSEKLSGFQPNGITDLPVGPDLPSPPSVSLPGVEPGKINIPDPSLLEIKRNSVELPQVNLSGASIPEIDQPAIPPIQKPESLGNYSGEIAEVTGKAKDYQQEIKQYSPGKFDEIKNTDQWEDKLSELDEVDEIKKQIDLADQAKRYFDPEVAKEEALNKAKKEAINHFAGHEEELKAAMEQLSKLKAKLPDTEGVVDLFAKHKNSLKEMSFIERLVPGLSLQFQKQRSFWLDVNPYIGYKISGRFVAGLGWNERLAYNFDNTAWDSQNHIYGLRSFLHFKLKTNFWLKGEVEVMNSPLRATQHPSSDIVSRGWVASYFGGIKKDFQLTKHLKGHVQMLYNLYNPEKTSPYTNRFNARMGFELPLKKKHPVKKNVQDISNQPTGN